MHRLLWLALTLCISCGFPDPGEPPGDAPPPDGTCVLDHDTFDNGCTLF